MEIRRVQLQSQGGDNLEPIIEGLSTENSSFEINVSGNVNVNSNNNDVNIKSVQESVYIEASHEIVLTPNKDGGSSSDDKCVVNGTLKANGVEAEDITVSGEATFNGDFKTESIKKMVFKDAMVTGSATLYDMLQSPTVDAEYALLTKGLHLVVIKNKNTSDSIEEVMFIYSTYDSRGSLNGVKIPICGSAPNLDFETAYVTAQNGTRYPALNVKPEQDVYAITAFKLWT